MGRMYLDRANTREQGTYTLLNMKIGYERENWDIYLAAKNLTNKEYFLAGSEDPTLGYMGTVGSPRTISLNVNY